MNYCSGLKSTLIVLGHFTQLTKIMIPIIIIGFGALDFFKAMTGSKDDEIKKSARSLMFRCLAGVCIFFLPYVLDLVFSWVDDWNTYEGSYDQCFQCIWNVQACTKE